MRDVFVGNSYLYHKDKSLVKRIFFVIRKYKTLYLMLLPGMLFLFIFAYLPMGGIIIVFKEYYPWEGLLGSKWVGFKHVISFFTDQQFWKILQNTVLIALYKLIVGFPAPIVLALLLNELKNRLLKRFVQTVSYLPHFISWMIVAGFAYMFFGTNLGILNKLLVSIGFEPVSWYYRSDLWRGILVVSAVWKGIGWGSIIYLAAISGIDVQLYESAIIDGAGRFKRMMCITIPGIMPIAVIIFILSVGNLIREDFQQIFALVGLNRVLYETTDVIETFIFRTSLLEGTSYSYPAAVGLFQSVVALLMILATNYFAKKKEQEGIW